MRKLISLVTVLFCVAFALTSCSDEPSDENATASGLETMPDPLADVCLSWMSDRKTVESSIPRAYSRKKKEGNTTVFRAVTDEGDIIISYSFDKDDKLIASCVTFNAGEETVGLTANALSGYETIEADEDFELLQNGHNIIGLSSVDLDGVHYTTLSYGPYVSKYSDDETDEWVDLGLSVMWAKCNIGASSPEEGGRYYAFGETTTKSSYWRENYTWAYPSGYDFNYRNPLKEISGTEYDVATKKLGEGWRLPTGKEATEFFSKCTFKNETLNGQKGVRATGPNGRSIFIPYVGIARQNGIQEVTNWLATGSSVGETSAYCIVMDLSFRATSSEWKAWGCTVRPVLSKE